MIRLTRTLICLLTTGRLPDIMINAWSLLYDELKMDNYEHTPEYYDRDRNKSIDDGIDDGMRPWGHSDYEFLIANKMTEKRKYKYSEDKILKELDDYIAGTYNQHYSAGDSKIQTLDLIDACGDGEAFCRSNILKYASRYDKKGTARRDIMKILHYAVLLMHFNDKNAQRETYPQ